ncbi:MAG: hypothetical protein HAW62_02455 [Endozoicomonadaceae bacterium]|nr:hypothetical protein [Endozoicomonadaceae bacterium]
MNALQVAIKKRLNRCSRKCFVLKLLTIIDWDAISHLLYPEKQKNVNIHKVKEVIVF